MDVTGAFRESAHRAYASQAGMTPDRADALVAPRDLPPPSARSQVLKSAHVTLVLVRELRAFVTRHRADYVREGKDSDTVRDGIESEVRLSVKACQAHITMLKSTVQEVEAAKTEGVQGVAHMHGVVLIVTEMLQRVAASFDQCREVRFKKVLAEAEHRRRRAPPRPPTPPRRNTEPAPAASTTDEGSTTETTETSGHQVQAQVHSTEGDVLVDELTTLVEQVRKAEGQVAEMSALSSLFATHVQAQAAQIEQLYAQAVESTRNLESGNVQLKKTIKRRGEGSFIVGIVLFIATFSLLFLDWLQG
jgi:syntaxin 18|tara:strand:- start:1758 stop:2672 length:915 start_codon:yes stop_codon:yes gene_type:complete